MEVPFKLNARLNYADKVWIMLTRPFFWHKSQILSSQQYVFLAFRMTDMICRHLVEAFYLCTPLKPPNNSDYVDVFNRSLLEMKGFRG